MDLSPQLAINLWWFALAFATFALPIGIVAVVTLLIRRHITKARALNGASEQQPDSIEGAEPPSGTSDDGVG